MAPIIPSHERPEPGSINIPLGKFPETSSTTPPDPSTIASKTITSLNTALTDPNKSALKTLFLENSYWRDHLALTWDFRTIHGAEKITEYAIAHSKGLSFEIDDSSPLKAPHTGPIDAFGEVHGIEFFVKIAAPNGLAHGVIRLAEENGEWKIFTVFTSLVQGGKAEVKREDGVQHGEVKGRKNWADRRTEESEYADHSPAVLVVGRSHLSPGKAIRTRTNTNTTLESRSRPSRTNYIRASENAQYRRTGY
jgi:hypothetical protein